MKKISLVLVLSLFVSGFLISRSASAQMKIAVVSLQQALNEVNEGKRAMASIKADIESKKSQLEKMKGDIKAKREALEKQRMVLSKEALSSKMNELQNQFLELQKKAMEYDQQVKTKESESVQRILKSLRGIVTEMAKKDGYDIVYENSADTVLYSKTAVDLTPDLIKAYNKR